MANITVDIKKKTIDIGSNLVAVGKGGMNPGVYDPQEIKDDVFDMDNMVDGVDKHYLTTEQIAEFEAKQNALTAGDNIDITNNVISATDTTYTAGDGICIDANNVISNTRVSAEWGCIQGNLSDQTDLQCALDDKQDVLTAGTNVQIENNVISATDTTYQSCDFDIKDLADSCCCRTKWNAKQNKLTAGCNINITGNTISAVDTTYQSCDFDIKDLADSCCCRNTWNNKQDKIIAGNNIQIAADGKTISATDTVPNNAKITIKRNNQAVGCFTTDQGTATCINIEVPTQACDIGAMPDSIKYGASLSMTMDTSTYCLTMQLKDQDGCNLGTACCVDLPIESMVVDGCYLCDTKEIELILQNGCCICFGVGDLVSGLQTEITCDNKLDADLVDDSSSINKFVTCTEKCCISSAVQPGDLANYAQCCDIPTDNCQLANTCGYTTCTGTLVASDIEDLAQCCDIPTDNCQLANGCGYTTCTGTVTSSDLCNYIHVGMNDNIPRNCYVRFTDDTADGDPYTLINGYKITLGQWGCDTDISFSGIKSRYGACFCFDKCSTNGIAQMCDISGFVQGSCIACINGCCLTCGGNICIQGGGGCSEWGCITGTLCDQSDLQCALDDRVPKCSMCCEDDVCYTFRYCDEDKAIISFTDRLDNGHSIEEVTCLSYNGMYAGYTDFGNGDILDAALDYNHISIYCYCPCDSCRSCVGIFSDRIINNTNNGCNNYTFDKCNTGIAQICDLDNYAQCCDIPTDNCQLGNGCGYTKSCDIGCTKIFCLSSLTDYTTAVSAYSWVQYMGGTSIVCYGGDKYKYTGRSIAGEYLTWQSIEVYNENVCNCITEVYNCKLTFNYDGGPTSIYSITKGKSTLGCYLRTDQNYSCPYTPQYDGSPATKKYVDDNIVTYSAGENISIDANNEISAIDTTYNAGEGISIGDGQVTARKGPSPDGFHVPSVTEWLGLKTIMDGLSLTTGNNWRINLHMPFAGAVNPNDAEIMYQGDSGFYWSSSPSNMDAYAYYLYLTGAGMLGDDENSRASGFSIRSFKDSFEYPTSSWTVIQGTLGGAGIFWNQSQGLISITNGTTGYTIMDKNLGATIVYNNGDELSVDNLGNMYQWGNNYGFSSGGGFDTSNEQVNALGYGPTNPYSSDIFIIEHDDWSTDQNDDLWGDTTGTITQENVISNTGVLSVNGQTGDVTLAAGGNVVGPLSSTDGNITLFDGNTGLLLKDSGVALSSKANTSDVLTKTNTTSFTPTADYHPATKKYVDDKSATVMTKCCYSCCVSTPIDGKIYFIKES